MNDQLTPRQEKIMNILVEIIWYGSVIGLFVLGAIALSQKGFKE